MLRNCDGRSGGCIRLLTILVVGWLTVGSWAGVLAVGGGEAMGRPQSMPLLFEEVGEGFHRTRVPGLTWELEPAGAVLTLQRPGGISARSHVAEIRSMNFRWVGASMDATARPEVAASARLHVFWGQDPSLWRTDGLAATRVRHTGVYPGIDVVYYGNDRQLEYDLVVAPGADPRIARFSVVGADRVWLSPEGDLVLELAGEEIRQRKPVAYQELAGRWEPVVVNYELTAAQPPVVGFEVGEYDRQQTLVIDPVVMYGAYFGGSAFDVCRRLLVTASGDLVVVGETTSRDLPTFQPLFQTNVISVTNTVLGGIPVVTEVTVTNVDGRVNRGGADLAYGNPLGNEAFVARFSADGQNLKFATYLGGGGIDAALDVAEDAEGNLLVFGLTQSPDFPVMTNAWSGMAYRLVETTNEIDGAEVVTWTQLTTNAWPIPEGWTPLWSTNISGEAYWGFYSSDAFLSVISAEGDDLLFSAYQGAAGENQGLRVATAPGERFYLISGEGVGASSLGFPLVACLQSNQLVYIQAPLADMPVQGVPTAAVADGEGRLWVAGQLQVTSVAAYREYVEQHGCLRPFSASNIPPFQCELGGTSNNVLEADAFVVRLDAWGGVDYFTCLGGSNLDLAMGLAIQADGGIVVAGHTSSADFPLQSALDDEVSGTDLFVTRLDGTLTNLVFSTYLGGYWRETLESMQVGKDGSLLLAGSTESPYSPWDAGAEAAFWEAYYATNRNLPLAGSQDRNGLVAALSPDGSRLLYGGIVGGDGDDELYDVGMAADGFLWVTGLTHGFGTNYNGRVGTNWWHESSAMNSSTSLWAQAAGFIARLYPGEARLRIEPGPEGFPLVSWPAVLPGYGLESREVLGATNSWSEVVETGVAGTNRIYSATNAFGQEYFQLRGQ